MTTGICWQKSTVSQHLFPLTPANTAPAVVVRGGLNVNKRATTADTGREHSINASDGGK